MGYFCNNENDHRREGRRDYEYRGHPDSQKYNNHWDDCSRYYREGYDEARREEERAQERREEERQREAAEDRQRQYRNEIRRQEEEEYYYKMEEALKNEQHEQEQSYPEQADDLPF